MNLKMIFSAKIGLLDHYNFAVHQIYIIWWHHTERCVCKHFFIHFPYILTLTFCLPLGFKGVVHFKYTVSTAMLLSSIGRFIWYTYWGSPGGVFNFTVSNSGEGGIKKLNFGFRYRGPDYFCYDGERSKSRLCIIKPN